MANDSASGGALLPSSAPPPSDLDLDVLFGRLVRAITGMAAGTVVPRAQPVPPKEPEPGTDWCAVGVMRTTPEDPAPVRLHDPAGDGGLGTDVVRRHEILEVLASFYGPHALGLAALLRDGFGVPQNREPLFHADMGFVGIGEIIAAPDLVNTQYRRRQDIKFRVRRRVDRVYPIRNLLSAGGTLQSEAINQTWSTENH